MNYKNAWKCHKCPQNCTEKGCPAWVEFMATTVATGAQELKKMCIFQALPVFLTHVIQASNRPAAAIENMRNNIVESIMLAATNRVMPEGKQLEYPHANP